MTFYAFGLNHETAPAQVRESFALPSVQQAHLYRSLSLSEEAEVILLSTCNRTEVYLYGLESDVDHVKDHIRIETGRPWPEEESFLFEDEDAVRHVLQVTVGLRSLVLGDAQILSQVKDAYRLSVEEDSVITVMHRLMHTAFRAAKSVARRTALSDGAASVSSAAVAVARTFFAPRSGLNGARVLLLGAGRMGILALEALQDDTLSSLQVTNRTSARAGDVAQRFSAEVVAWEDRDEAVAAADLVIVATGADEPVVRASELDAHPHDRQTLLIDIAVPRNVEQDVRELEGYTVYDLDMLNDELVMVEHSRRSEAPAAEAIVEDELGEFVSWYFHQQALQPAIHAVRDTFESIRREEIERHVHRFSSADIDELDRLTRSILQKVLAVPIVRLKSVDPESIDFVRGIKLLNTLFARPGCEDAGALEEQAALQTEEPAAEDLIARLRERLQSL